MFLLRRQRRPLARFALCAFLCGWMLPFYRAHPMGLADDSACLVAPEWDAPTTPKVDARVRGDGQPAHCVVCHLIRALSGAVASDAARLLAPLEASSGPLLTDRLTLPVVQAAPSSRGPPGFLSI